MLQVESAPPVKAGPAVQELIAENPEKVLRTLQREGVQLLGEFRVEASGHLYGYCKWLCNSRGGGDSVDLWASQDRLVLGRLGDDSIITMGADR